jgi:hypothetical protein
MRSSVAWSSCIVAVLVVVSGVARGDSTAWRDRWSHQGDDWFDPANWTNGIPRSVDTVVIHDYCDPMPVISGSLAVAGTLLLGDGAVTLTIAGGELRTGATIVREATVLHSSGTHATGLLVLSSLNEAVYRLSGSGYLSVDAVGSASMEAHSKMYQTGGVFDCGGTLTIGGDGFERYYLTGGVMRAATIRIQNAWSSANLLEVGGGALQAGLLELGVKRDPLMDWHTDTFRIASSSSHVELGSITLGTRARIEAEPGSAVHFVPGGGDCRVTIGATNADNLAGLRNIAAYFDGGTSVLEAASLCTGDDSAFAFGAVYVGLEAQARLLLEDQFDNGRRTEGRECLRTYELDVAQGSYIELGGLSLLVAGDVAAELSGMIADGRLRNGGASHLEAIYDSASGWTAVHAPEPVTAMTLLAGLGALLSRRRRPGRQQRRSFR